MFGSAAKYSNKSLSSRSARFPMLTKAETPSSSWLAQSIRAAPTVPLWEMTAMHPRAVRSGQEAHRP